MQNSTIAVDARPLAREMSGIRRYTEELLNLLVKDTNIHWLLYTDRQLEDDIGLAEKDNVEVYVIPFQRGAKFLWPLYSMRWLYQHKPDIYWSPRHHLPVSTPKDTILFLTIHDLVWMESRGTMPAMAYASEWLWSRRSIAKANIILAASNTTSRKIRERFKTCKAPVFTITNGYNPPELASKPKALDTKSVGDFFLAVGTHEPRKNYAVLLSAFANYVNSGGEKALLIAGNEGWGVNLKQLVRASSTAENKVVILENISDYELKWCYEHASALVSASLNEGFGIPLIEAQYFAVPLIVSDIEPYKEIAGSEAAYFNPLNRGAITQALLTFDQATGRSDHVSSTNKYSWGTSANQLSALFLSSLKDQNVSPG